MGMSFLQQVGTGQNYADAAKQRQTQMMLDALKLKEAQQQQSGSQLAGKIFPSLFNNAGQPPLPGSAAMPWAGGGAPPPSPTGLPNGGAPPIPGAPPVSPVGGSAPVRGGDSAGAPPAMAAPGQTNGLSWQQLAMAIKKQAPDADGATIMQVITQYAPMMNQQSKMDLALMQLMVRDTIAQMNNSTREDIANKNIAGRKDVANINQSGQNNRMDKRLSASGGLDYKTATQNLKTAQSNLNNVRISTPKDTKAIAAAQAQVKEAQDVFNKSTKGGTDLSNIGGPAGGGEVVNVVSPDGTPGTIPKENLDAALKAGYKQQ